MARRAQAGTRTSRIKPVPIARFRDEVLGLYKSKSIYRYQDIRRVFRIAEGLGVGTTTGLTPEFLDRFHDELKLRAIGDVTLAKTLDVFGTVCNLTVRRGALECTPFAARPALKLWLSRTLQSNTRPDPTSSPSQIKALFAGLDETAGNDLHRRRADVIRALVVYGGLDLDETSRIRVRDVDFENGVIRYTDRKGVKRTAVMCEELARILRDWLDREIRYAKASVNDAKVQKIRDAAKEERLTTGELAKRFGESWDTVRAIVKHATWQNVPGGAEAPVRVSDQEWLLPTLRPGESGPLLKPQRGFERDRGRFVDACGAAGIKPMNLGTLRGSHTIHAARAGGPTQGTQAAPVPAIVKLYDRTYNVLCNIKGLRTKAQRRAVDRIIAGGKDGLDKTRLRAGGGDDIYVYT